MIQEVATEGPPAQIVCVERYDDLTSRTDDDGISHGWKSASR